MSLGHVRQPEFGRRLRRLREQRGLSQRDLAGDAVNPSYISLLESGSRLPTLQVVIRLSDVLGVPLTELAGPPPVAEAGDRDRNARLVSDILARSSLDLGDLADAQERYAGAYAAARQAGELAEAIGHGMALQEIFELRADHKAGYEQLVELAPLVAELDMPELALVVEIHTASAAQRNDRLGEALELAEHVVARIGDTMFAGTWEHVGALGVLVSVRCECGRLDDLPRLLDTMLAMADRLGDGVTARPAMAGRAYWAAGVAYARLGDVAATKRHIRYAKNRLASPAISLREWARFCRAAASALLDVAASADEVEYFVRGVQAALSMVEVPGEADLLRLLRARFALARGDAGTALALTEDEPVDLSGVDRVTLRATRGRALWRSGRPAEAVDVLRSAARLAEDLAQYRLSTVVWRDIDEIRSAV